MTARFFRLTIRTPEPQPQRSGAGRPGGGGGFGGFGERLELIRPPGAPPRAGAQTPAAPAGTQIAELVLHGSTPVNRFQEKAAFSAASGIYDMATPAVQASDAIPKQTSSI